MTTIFASIHPAASAAGTGSLIGPSGTAASRIICYHCALPLDGAIALHANINRRSREPCYAGYQAAAQALYALDMGHIYDGLITFAGPIEGGRRTEAKTAWVTYNLPVVCERFVRSHVDGSEELSFTIGDMRCVTYVRLIERALSRVLGMREVTVNYVMERVHIADDAGALRPSTVSTAITDARYEAWPDQPPARRTAEARERRSLLIRLELAMLGMMQMMMYA